MRNLKSILEGIFDDDLVEKEVEFGSMFELSGTAHHNSVSNDLEQILRCFNKKKLAQQASKTKSKVDKNNSFIDYWDGKDHTLRNLVDVLLGMPAQLILSAGYSGNWAMRMSLNDEKKVKDYLDKFLSRPKDLSVCVIKYQSNDYVIYNIDFIYGIFDSKPSRLNLRFLKK